MFYATDYNKTTGTWASPGGGPSGGPAAEGTPPAKSAKTCAEATPRSAEATPRSTEATPRSTTKAEHQTVNATSGAAALPEGWVVHQAKHDFRKILTFKSPSGVTFRSLIQARQSNEWGV
jgi:hypothetical protein